MVRWRRLMMLLSERGGGREGGSRNEALFSPSLPFSLARSLVPWQSVIRVGSRRFVSRHHSVRPPAPVRARPEVRPLRHIQVETPSVRPSLLSKNDYGIEMKIRSGIHPSPFLFGPRFCTITSHFLSSLQHQSFIVSFNIVHLIPTYPSIALEKLK